MRKGECSFWGYTCLPWFYYVLGSLFNIEEVSVFYSSVRKSFLC